MANIKSVSRSTVARKSTTVRHSSVSSSSGGFDTVTLPKVKTKPTQKLSDFSWVIYGDRKIGKTSLCAQFPKALIYGFEAGTKALEVFSVDLPTWKRALSYNNELFENGSQFENVVVDTGSIAYDRNMQHICDKLGIDHPQDLGYGKGWNAVKKSFEKFHLDILNNGFGLVITAHEKHVEEELPSGLHRTKVEPDLSGGATAFYLGLVDIVAHYHFIGTERFLTIRGNEFECAGNRMKLNFRTTSGEPVYRIPMGNSEEEAYANLVNAFNNKQVKSYKDHTARKETKTVSRVNKR